MRVDYHQFINRNLPSAERSCTSKTMYVSRGEAKSVARQGRLQDGSLRPYRCRFCPGWHLGHRRKRMH
jgi:hypothetical protein